MDTNLLKPMQTEDNARETVYRGVRTGHSPTCRGVCNLFISDIPFVVIENGDKRPYFEWGGVCLGSKRLALTILHDLFREEYWTQENRDALLHDHIIRLPFDGWELRETELLGWMDVLERERDKKEHEFIMANMETSSTK